MNQRTVNRITVRQKADGESGLPFFGDLSGKRKYDILFGEERTAVFLKQGCFDLLEAAASRDSLDWKEIPADEIHRRVTEKVKPGSIVLFHNAEIGRASCRERV